MRKTLITLLLGLCASMAMAQYSAVRINALGVATGTINAGVDVAISDKWSIDGSLYWNPITTENLCINTLALTLGVRRWRFEPHVGLFWSPHTTVAHYKIGNSNTRYNGYLVGVGSSLGYSLMVAKRWNFTIEGGLGIFYMNDTKWNPNSSPLEDVLLQHTQRIVIAPSKLEISFSYLF